MTITTDLPRATSTISGWAAHRRRYAVLRRVVADLDRSPDGPLPWDAEVAEAFENPADLLLALHGLWWRGLAAAVDTALELEDGDPAAIVRAWRRRAELMPGVRRVLDRCADDPVLARALRLEHRMLAVAAGRATLADPWQHSADLGAELAREARATARPARRRRRLARC